MQEPPVPTWKFWHPLSIWHVLAIGLVTQIVMVVPIAMLNGGLHLDIPMWIPNGLAGVTMWLVVRYFAQRKLRASGK